MAFIRLSALALLALLLPVALSAAPKTRQQRKEEITTKLADNTYVAGPQGAEVVELILRLQEEVSARGGCGANICFGIDGSRKITQDDYTAQIDFMALMGAVVEGSLPGRPVPRLMAYEYGLRLKTISAPTENAESFLDRIDSWHGGPNARFSFLAPAILRCRSVMGRDLFINDANKIVLIGDGRTNFRAPRLAIDEARKFQPPEANGAICAITVRNPDTSFLNNLTGDPRLVLNVADTKEFIYLLEQVVKGVCDFF